MSFFHDFHPVSSQSKDIKFSQIKYSNWDKNRINKIYDCKEQSKKQIRFVSVDLACHSIVPYQGSKDRIPFLLQPATSRLGISIYVNIIWLPDINYYLPYCYWFDLFATLVRELNFQRHFLFMSPYKLCYPLAVFTLLCIQLSPLFTIFFAWILLRSKARTFTIWFGDSFFFFVGVRMFAG